MFAKDTEKMESFIGAKSDLTGEISVKGTLRVDGKVNGRVNADCVILSETGLIKGEVMAKKIIVGGKVEGNLKAQELVEIKSKGRIWGEIFTHKLSVLEGGEFNGKIEMKTEDSKLIEFESKNVGA